MPIAKCTNCNRTTNSATSNYWLDTETDSQTPKEIGVATGCHAAFVDGKWIEGCMYENLDPIAKRMIDHFLAKQKGV